MNLFITKKLIKNKSGTWIIENEKYEKTIENNNEKINGIPIIIIKEILNSKQLYKQTYKNFTINNQSIKITSSSKNLDDTLRFLTYDKNKFIDSLKKLLNNNKLSSLEQKRANELIVTNEYSFYEEKISKKIVVSNITIKEIIDLLSKDKEELLNLLKKETILGISKTELADILNKPPFSLQSEESSICISFNFNSELTEKIITNYEEIKYLYSKDEIAEQPFPKNTFDMSIVNINPQLSSNLLNEVPSSFTKLQKIYYIYRRLCQKLTYDEEYFAGNQSRIFSINHTDINRLQVINDDNNIVICYEVVMILAKFCEILNIPFNILTYKNKEVTKYAKGHTKLRLKVGEFIITTDPTSGIIRSDLVSEKTEQIVENFELLNTHPRTKDEFEKQLKEVDDNLELNKKESNFLECIEIYQLLYQQNKDDLTIKERVDLFTSLITETKLDIMDSLEYFLNLRKIIFGIRYNANCQIIYVSNNKPSNKLKKVSVTLIIIYNDTSDIIYNKDNNNYILIESDKTIKNIQKEELQTLFDNKTLTIIKNSKFREIPGITIKEEVSDELYEQVKDSPPNRRKT